MNATMRAEPTPPVTSRAREHFAATSAVADAFFREHANAIARACQAMARQFQSGGRLLVFGEGAQRSDVAHVVVEFLHPVVVGKRALPALALHATDASMERSLSPLARRGDILLVLTQGAVGTHAAGALERARALGVLTIVLAGSAGSGAAHADHLFVVPSSDACVVQETHEMLYHVLWELVHVFLDHRMVSA